MMIVGFNAYAQTGSVKGKLTEKDGNPIGYVNVLLEETKQGTITDDRGLYEINNVKSGNYTLIVSSVSHKPGRKEIIIKDGETITIDFILETGSLELDEVVITTNRDTETRDEIPSSISVLTAKGIEEAGQSGTNLSDVIATIPGVALSSNIMFSQGQNIRGRNMLVMIDGIPQSTPLRPAHVATNTIDASVLERIEVIKGATSIYGNGADGGIINYITKQPKGLDRLQSSTTIGSTGSLVDIDHTVGSYLSQQFSGRLNKFSYVLSGRYKQTGVQRDAKGEILSPNFGLGERQVHNAFAKIGYQVNDNNKIEWMYNFYNSSKNSNYIHQDGVYGESPASALLGDPDPDAVTRGIRYNHNAQLKYISHELFGKTDVDVSLYYQDFKWVTYYSYWFKDFRDPNKPYTGGQSSIKSTKKGARLNFNTKYTLGGINGNFVYGLDILGDNTLQDLADGRGWVPPAKMKNVAPYFQVKARFNGLVFKGGIRHENININIEDYETLYIDKFDKETSEYKGYGGVAISGGNLKYNATVFNLGLRYNKIDRFKPFASYSQSFSIADLGRTLRTATESTIAKINSEAAISNNYELGFNSGFGKINFQGAYFISTADLGASYEQDSKTGAYVIIRQPEKVSGFELQLDAKITDGIQLGTSYYYVEGRIDGDDNGSYNDESDSYLNGDRISPPKLSAYLSYQLTDKWYAKLSSVFSGQRKRFDPDPTGKYSYAQGPIDSFTLTNFYTSYQLSEKTKLAIGIRNIFNEDFYSISAQWRVLNYMYAKGDGTQFNVSLNITL